jgi:hypothetical protein
MKAYDDLLHLQTKFSVDLSKDQNTQTILNALCFWEGKRIENQAICVMPNHVHWVVRLFEKDENGEPVIKADLKSVDNKLPDCKSGRKGDTKRIFKVFQLPKEVDL